MVLRSMWPSRGHAGRRSAAKPASASELSVASALLDGYVQLDANSGGAETARREPIYLEVGYGLDPMALRGQRAFNSKKYIGIDSATGNYENPLGAYPDAVRQASAQFADSVASERAGQHILFAASDADRLPLPTNSVREIFMSNVLNAPLESGARSDILREAGRVIEARGNLIVRVNWHQESWPAPTMAEYLKQGGFQIVRSVAATDTEYARLDSQYGVPTQIPAPEGYYLVAEPGNSPSAY
jgi:hypothetical protein